MGLDTHGSGCRRQKFGVNFSWKKAYLIEMERETGIEPAITIKSQ
jgi:hypothetical protein